ncbi:MAG TPA: hypothetical protein VK866_19040 [Acidimicrobiales bacterium]|nr:hypothetical protein [Acidimicrobiales bacterium]
MALTFTATGSARPRADGVEIPVVGGVVTVLAEPGDVERLVARCGPGARLTARVTDSGPGWWLAAAARVEGGLDGPPNRPVPPGRS